MTGISRRDFLGSIACALAVAGIGCKIPANAHEAGTERFWRPSPVGMKFVDALGNLQPALHTGDLVMLSDWAGGGFAGYVCGFRKNPWDKWGDEGDFIAVIPPGYKVGDYTETRLSSSLRRATHADLAAIGLML